MVNLDFNSKTQTSDRVNLLINTVLEKENQAQPSRNYLGGSRLGVECERSLQYEYFNTPKDEGKDFPGRILDIFSRGHWAEDLTIKNIRKAGFILKTEQSNGKQFGFSVLDGKIKGHCDGVFVGGPDIFKYPALWECKCVQEKDWKVCKKDGVKKKYPVYYAQMQVYMAYFKLTDNPAIFTAINANNMERYWELVPFNGPAAQELSDKGVRIIKACEAGEQLPKISNDPTFFKCKWCSWSERCHQ